MNAITPFPVRPSESRVLWNDEAVETVIRLSASGRSAGEIARAMFESHPGITRNAVIGKLHRLGHSGGGRQPNKDRAPRSQAVRLPALRPTACAPRVGQGVRARSPRVEHYVDKTPAPIVGSATIIDLKDSVCHFPYGDPRDLESFRYCGAQIGEGELYCAGHRRVMYVPLPKKAS